jgi:hypothetical protein
MNYFRGLKTNKIKRKNFFYYLGASAFGIYTISQIPFNKLQSKFRKEIHPKTDLKVKQNPHAVKRNVRGNNG